MAWTKDQENAIKAKGSNILVSAAAGSGKTTVLIERTIRKVIEEGVDLDSLLIVTFTKAAAEEMKKRLLEAIYKKLEDDPNNERLKKQLSLLPGAYICTIDKFFNSIVKNNFYKINVSPNYSVLGDEEIIIKNKVMNKLFEDLYDKNDKDFIDCIKEFCNYKDDIELKELIDKIYNKISSKQEPYKWLHEKLEDIEKDLDKDIFETKLGKQYQKGIKENLEVAENTLLDTLKYIKKFSINENAIRLFNADLAIIREMKSDLDSYEKLYQKINNKDYEWVRNSGEFSLKSEMQKLPENEMAQYEILKNIRDNNKTFVKKITLEDPNEQIEINKNIINNLKKLFKLVELFNKAYDEEKRKKNYFDFNDISNLTYKILIDENGNPTKTAEEYKNKFKEIAIDEYQDTNDLQEKILTTISNNNLYMVGDVKQSIYKFRDANPKNFQNKYETYEKIKKENIVDLEKNTKILLKQNFRSRNIVLDTTNFIFKQVMSKEVGELEYKEDESLYFGQTDYLSKDDKKTELYELYINNQDEEEDDEITQLINDDKMNRIKSYFIANKIEELIKSKYQVWDRKKKEFRDICYKDITIIAPKVTSISDILEKALDSYNIPSFNEKSAEYLNTYEIECILNILRIIENPKNDYANVMVLSSDIFKFSANELLEIKLMNKESFIENLEEYNKLNKTTNLGKNVKRYLDLLSKWKEDEERKTLCNLIWEIYTDTGFFDYVGIMPNGELKQANLKLLFEKAVSFENNNFKGLYEFIRFIEDLQAKKVHQNIKSDIKNAKIISEKDNVVNILTIHKSKGLEFPVVIFYDNSQSLLSSKKDTKLVYDEEYGFFLKKGKDSKNNVKESIIYKAINVKNNEESLSEKLRLLYVSLTRASEQLIIVGDKKVNNHETSNIYYEKKKIQPSEIKTKNNYVELIKLTLMSDKEGKDYIKLNEVEFNNYYIKGSYHKEEGTLIKELKNKNVKHTLELDKILNWEYKYKESTKTPTKTSVTEIKKAKFKKSINEKNMLINLKDLNIKEDSTKLSPNEIGTIMHLIIQELDTSKDYNKNELLEFLEQLVEQKVLTKNEINQIDTKRIMNYINSKLYKRVQQAKLVKKEKEFLLELNSSIINEENTKDTVIVQGEIDLYFIDKDDKLVLVDYKTDKISNIEQLVERYKIQLEIYKTALENATGRKVDEAYIYSIFKDEYIIL